MATLLPASRARGLSHTALVRLLALALLLTSSGCASCESAPVDGYDDEIEGALAEELARVGLGSGDVFEVSVWGEPSMSGIYRVGPDGQIHFPLVGTLEVQGLTPNEAATLIRDRLQDGYLKAPNVSVFIKEANSKKVFVLGEVIRPGTFPFVANMTIVEAITTAGGFNASANRNNVIVTRRSPQGDNRVRLPVEKITRGEAPNYGLRPGDIIFVPDRLL